MTPINDPQFWVGTAVNLVAYVVAVAVAWGVLKTTVTTLKDGLARLSLKIENGLTARITKISEDIVQIKTTMRFQEDIEDRVSKLIEDLAALKATCRARHGAG